MRYFVSFAIAMLFAFGGLAQADEPNGPLKEGQLYSLQLTYRVDGKVVATPNITVRSGQKAEIESLRGYPYKIDLLLEPAAVSSAKQKIALSLNIYSRDDFAANENKWKKIASPVIVKALDDNRLGPIYILDPAA